MQYTLQKQLSQITLVNKEDGSVVAKCDYTITGKGAHNGVDLEINSGESVEIPIPSELIAQADTAIQEKINSKYINDPQ